ncbi:hypothetical protein [Sinanaerobacter chloroacetimidivorans]
MERYINFYNNDRPHATLDYKSPHTRKMLKPQ